MRFTATLRNTPALRRLIAYAERFTAVIRVHLTQRRIVFHAGDLPASLNNTYLFLRAPVTLPDSAEVSEFPAGTQPMFDSYTLSTADSSPLTFDVGVPQLLSALTDAGERRTGLRLARLPSGSAALSVTHRDSDAKRAEYVMPVVLYAASDARAQMPGLLLQPSPRPLTAALPSLGALQGAVMALTRLSELVEVSLSTAGSVVLKVGLPDRGGEVVLKIEPSNVGIITNAGLDLVTRTGDPTEGDPPPPVPHPPLPGMDALAKLAEDPDAAADPLSLSPPREARVTVKARRLAAVLQARALMPESQTLVVAANLLMLTCTTADGCEALVMVPVQAQPHF